MKETLQILFTGLTSDEILSIIPHEKDIFLRMYNDESYTNDPTKPHGYIKNIMFDEYEGFMAFVDIPDESEDVYQLYTDPVISPIIEEVDGYYKITAFSLYERANKFTRGFVPKPDFLLTSIKPVSTEQRVMYNSSTFFKNDEGT